MSNLITMNADRNVIELITGQDTRNVYSFKDSWEVRTALESSVTADLLKAEVTVESIERMLQGLIDARAMHSLHDKKYAAGRDHVQTVIANMPFRVRGILGKVFGFEPIRSAIGLFSAIRAMRVVLARVLFAMHQGVEHDLQSLNEHMESEGYELAKGYTLQVEPIHTTDGSKGIFVYRGNARVAQVFGGSTEVRFIRLTNTPYVQEASTGKDSELGEPIGYTEFTAVLDAVEEEEEEEHEQTLREAQEALNTQLSCNAMSEDEAICIQFFGLYGVWFWVATDKFASYEGDLREMLTDNGVSEANADHILNHDWAYADYQGHATRQCASEWSFDWDLYNEIQESDMELEVILAGLAMGLSMDEIEDKYYGYFETEEDLAYEFVESTGMLADVPDNVKSYFDYERYGRDLAMDYSVHDNHYFSH